MRLCDGRRDTKMSMNPSEISAEGLQDPDTFRREVAEACRPVVIRGLVRAWPAVVAVQESMDRFKEYLLQFDEGHVTEVFVADARIAGKYYYSDDLKGFNFERRQLKFAEALDRIFAPPTRTTIYMGSLPIDRLLPGFAQQNYVPIVPSEVVPRIWLGHASNVACHYDTFDNVACVVAGTRRFTLYAPETIGDLYVGPIDHTMAGQPVSLAASAPENDERYPRFRAIREQAWIAELHPGDAIYIPKLWWHQVEALSEFNAMVNYWWDVFSIGPDAPSTALLLSMITIAERPPAERQAWKAFFDHYVFRTNGHPLAHLPPEQHGVLGPLKPHNYGRIRAHIMQLLRSV
nr:cupin-like domain-containing protein [Gammaproteobacteria bacterium]